MKRKKRTRTTSLRKFCLVAAVGAVAAVLPCLQRDRVRDASCRDRIDLGLEALQRTRELCRSN